MSSIFHRISVRKFEDRPIEKEKIVQVLKAGMQAPSACNQQPWEYKNPPLQTLLSIPSS